MVLEKVESSTLWKVELNARVEELESLKDQIQGMGTSITKAVSDGDLNY
jgi:hypothetical protein